MTSFDSPTSSITVEHVDVHNEDTSDSNIETTLKTQDQSLAVDNKINPSNHNKIKGASQHKERNDTHSTDAEGEKTHIVRTYRAVLKTQKVLLTIFSFLSSPDLGHIMTVNQHWFYVANHPRLWHERGVFSPVHEEQLKFDLLWFLVDEEVHQFIREPTFDTLQETLLIKESYEALNSFPLYVHQNAAFKERLKSLFLAAPKLIQEIKMATKKDVVTDTKELLLLLFDNLLRTPFRRTVSDILQARKDNNASNGSSANEGSKEQTLSQHSLSDDDEDTWYDGCGDEDLGSEEKMYRRDVSKRAAVATKLAHHLTLEIQHSGGVRKLSSLFKTCKTFDELPETYHTLFDATRTVFVDMLFHELHHESSIRKLKTIYTLTPVLALKGLLTITNPLRLVNGMFSLFLARPFGSRSILQRIMEVVVELSRTKNEMKQMQKTFIKDSNFEKNTAKKIVQYISTYVEQIDFSALFDIADVEEFSSEKIAMEEKRRMMHQISGNNTLSNSFNFEMWTAQQIELGYNVFRLCVRWKQKKMLVDLIGQDEIITPLRQLAHVTLAPLMDLYAVGNIGACLTVLSNTVSEIIKAAQLEDMQQKEQQYRSTLKHAEYKIYELLFIQSFLLRAT